jgi:N-methylhydantoinase A
MLSIGVDIGGTFTDVLVNESGRLRTLKVPSTRSDPAAAVIEGVREASERFGFSLGDVDLLAHGTTVATNVLVQRHRSRTALITTRGFRDVLEIGTLSRPPEALYDPHWRKPAALVPRSLRFEVTERVSADGSVDVALDLEDLDRAIDGIRQADLDAVAIAFLFSFRNDAHERAAADRVRAALPDVTVLTSSGVLPEVREYDRTSTTVIAAHLAPAVDTYIRRLGDALAGDRVGRFFVMQSNGGLSTPDEVLANPGRLVMSGPAAGVNAVCELGDALGLPNLISVDMGGTSFDVALVREGAAHTTMDYRVEGAPLKVPMTEILTIGAGGGSIAFVPCLRVRSHDDADRRR